MAEKYYNREDLQEIQRLNNADLISETEGIGQRANKITEIRTDDYRDSQTAT